MEEFTTFEVLRKNDRLLLAFEIVDVLNNMVLEKEKVNDLMFMKGTASEILLFASVANSLKPNMANGIENHGHYGQIFSQIWPKYGHFFSEFRPYLQFLLHFYVTIFAKISNWKINFTNCFLKNF